MKNLKSYSAFLLLCFVGFQVSLFSQPQIEIDSVIGTGRDAISVEYAQGDGIEVKSSGGVGIRISEAGGDGINVSNTGYTGVTVSKVEHGFWVHSSNSNGLLVSSAGGHGVNVLNAGGYGILILNADDHSMNIQGSKSASTLAGHIGLIKNRSTTTNADVLALQVGTTGNPGPGNNFISFYNGSASSVGRIEGNGSGGILFGTSGGDFAECLPRSNQSDVFVPGDVIGVHGGKISHTAAGASQLMVITDRPAVLGNQPEDDDSYESVSFIGRVPVRVRGPVRAGDWIVASGMEDGTGMAIPCSQITMEHQIVGRAWESNDDPGIKRVNTVVGLDHSAAKDVIIRNIQTELLEQRTLTKSLQKQVQALKQLISRSQTTTIQP